MSQLVYLSVLTCPTGSLGCQDRAQVLCCYDVPCLRGNITALVPGLTRPTCRGELGVWLEPSFVGITMSFWGPVGASESMELGCHHFLFNSHSSLGRLGLLDTNIRTERPVASLTGRGEGTARPVRSKPQARLSLQFPLRRVHVARGAPQAESLVCLSSMPLA